MSWHVHIPTYGQLKSFKELTHVFFLLLFLKHSKMSQNAAKVDKWPFRLTVTPMGNFEFSVRNEESSHNTRKITPSDPHTSSVKTPNTHLRPHPGSKFTHLSPFLAGARVLTGWATSTLSQLNPKQAGRVQRQRATHTSWLVIVVALGLVGGMTARTLDQTGNMNTHWLHFYNAARTASRICEISPLQPWWTALSSSSHINTFTPKFLISQNIFLHWNEWWSSATAVS